MKQFLTLASYTHTERFDTESNVVRNNEKRIKHLLEVQNIYIAYIKRVFL